MPIWHVYHPQDAFTDDDKQAIAQNVTGIYESFLPRFYVNVLFIPVPKSSLYIGGEPTGDFVRVWIDHIARSIKDTETRDRFMKACGRALDPFVAQRGLRWELHVDETPLELWTVNGLNPPPPNSPAELKWRAENRATPYEA